MVVGPRAVVAAPAPVPGRRGIVAAAVELTEGDERWVNGFAFAPESCDGATGIPLYCGQTGATKTAGGNPETVEYDPWAVLGWDECSTLQRGRDRAGRARRQLIATESAQIEAELWDGAIARAEGYPNPYLAKSTTVELGTFPPVAALAQLEQALAECLHGQRGMIHATPATVTGWASVNLVRVESGLLLTAMDTIVVAGAGYSGSAPNAVANGAPVPPVDPAASAHAYGTGIVYLRRGQITPVGEETSQVDRAVNTQTVFVERPVAAIWNACCTIGVEVDL